MGSQFLIDVMEVITKGLRADAKSVRDLFAFFAPREHAQNVFFLFGQRWNGRWMRRALIQGAELFGQLKHLVRQFFALLLFRDVVGKVNQKPLAGALVVEYDRGHVDPRSFSRARPDAHVKVGNLGVTAGTLDHATVLVADARAERSHTFQELVAGFVDGRGSWIAK